MLRPCLPRRRLCLKAYPRSIHTIPRLGPDFTEGVPNLLTARAFDIAWTQYHGLMLEKLNALVAGREIANKSPKDILLKCAREPGEAAIFNYASMAHNNHFFFQALSPSETKMPRPLEEDLLRSFSSIETLRREMIITANAMFGPGFVWLVRSRDHKYSILSTYIAGSPYPGAHYRRQPVDMNTEAKNVTDVLRNVIRDSPVNNVGAFGSLSEPRNQFAPGGIDINPVLCINVWEHVYLPDYGVGGKLEYAVNWWQAINWSEVANRAGIQPNQKYVT